DYAILLADRRSAGQVPSLQPHHIARRADVQRSAGPEACAEQKVAASADDEKHAAVDVGIDRHDVVPKQPVEAGGIGRYALSGNRTVQVHVFGRHLGQGVGVYRIDERLNVDVEDFWWLGLGADIRQPQPVPSYQRRQKLIGKDTLYGTGVGRIVRRKIRSRTKEWI